MAPLLWNHYLDPPSATQQLRVDELIDCKDTRMAYNENVESLLRSSPHNGGPDASAWDLGQLLTAAYPYFTSAAHVSETKLPTLMGPRRFGL